MKLLLAASVLLVWGDISLKAAAQNCGAITTTSHHYDFETDSGTVRRLSSNERVVFKTAAKSFYTNGIVSLYASFNIPRGNSYKALCTHNRDPHHTFWLITRGNGRRRLSDMPTNFELSGGSGNQAIEVELDLRQGVLPGLSCELEVRSDRCGNSDPARPTPSPHIGAQCNCGVANRRERIIGGRNADVGEYPWMVHLVTTYTNKYSGVRSSYGCGGTIISEEYILTAAHCAQTEQYDKNGPMLTYVGDFTDVNVLIDSVDSQDHHSIRSTEVYRHEGYKGTKTRDLSDDIALVKVPRIQFSRTVGTVCLPPTNVNFQGMDSLAIGWGMINSMGDTARHLQEIEMRVATDAHCKANWAQSYSHDLQICNEFKHEEGTCEGDSGGPLAVDMDGHYYEVGIVSFGDGEEQYTCNKGRVGVFTRVTGYLDWIRRTIQNNRDTLPCSL